MNIQIKDRLSSYTIFEYDIPHNTMGKTIAEAIRVAHQFNSTLGIADIVCYGLFDYDDLIQADLSIITKDLFFVLEHARDEVPYLMEALNNGRIDGSVYEGDCCCLMGTLCKVRKVKEIEGVPNDVDSPIEQWFMAINKGDTPFTSPIARITSDWLNYFHGTRPRDRKKLSRE